MDPEQELSGHHNDPKFLESASRRKQRQRSIAIIHIATFFISLGCYLMLTGTLPYLRRLLPSIDDEDELMTKYAFITAAQPLGQLFLPPIYGWIVTRVGSIRHLSFTCGLIFAMANALSAILLVFKEENRFWIFFVARLFTGVASACRSPWRSYLSDATYTCERTFHVSLLSVSQTVAFLCGPLIQAALTALGCEQGEPGGVTIDTYTLANWLSALMGSVTFLVFLPGIFQQINVATEEKDHLISKSSSETIALQPDIPVAIVCIICNFFILSNYVVIETLGVPICMDQFGWTESETLKKFGLFMSIGALVSVAILLSLKIVTNRFDERKVLLFGIVLMILSRLVMMPLPGNDYPPLKPEDGENWPYNNTNINHHHKDWPQLFSTINSGVLARDTREPCEPPEEETSSYCDYDWCDEQKAMAIWQLFLGYLFTLMSFPLITVIPISIFTKILGPLPQGVWMGVLITFGTLARVITPLIVTVSYTNHGTYMAMTIVTLFSCVPLVLNILYYKRLIPLTQRVNTYIT